MSKKVMPASVAAVRALSDSVRPVRPSSAAQPKPRDRDLGAGAWRGARKLHVAHKQKVARGRLFDVGVEAAEAGGLGDGLGS